MNCYVYNPKLLCMDIVDIIVYGCSRMLVYLQNDILAHWQTSNFVYQNIGRMVYTGMLVYCSIDVPVYWQYDTFICWYTSILVYTIIDMGVPSVIEIRGVRF